MSLVAAARIHAPSKRGNMLEKAKPAAGNGGFPEIRNRRPATEGSLVPNVAHALLAARSATFEGRPERRLLDHKYN